MARLSEIRVPAIFKPNVEAVNDEGGEEQTHIAGLETFVAVKRISQSRAIEAGIDSLIEADLVEVRNLDLEGLNKDWIIEYDGKDHIIHSIDPFGLNRRQWIQLITKVKS